MVFLIVLCACGMSKAQSNQEMLWRTAQDAFLTEDYEHAIQSFEEYLLHEPKAYSAMYNLGNCYLQTNNLGKAILWYERARKLRPNDDDVVLNLSIAKARRENPVVEIRGFFLMRWMHFWSGILTVGAWGVMSLIFFWIAIGCIIWRIRTGRSVVKYWIVGISSACFVMSVILGAQRYHDMNLKNVAVVLEHVANVSIAPDDGSKLVAKIGAGEKVAIIDSLNTYYKIRLANFEQGWISAESIEKI